MWNVKPIAPNHGKALVVSEFESTAWLGDLAVWVTGEADLSVGQKVVDRCISTSWCSSAQSLPRKNSNRLLHSIVDTLAW
jgi:hypothetical protein